MKMCNNKNKFIFAFQYYTLSSNVQSETEDLYKVVIIHTACFAF